MQTMTTDDATVLFYTANKLEESFASRVRAILLKAIGDVPLISISHKPMSFGENIVVDLPVSTHSIYRQILIGAKAAKTKYVACAEDDALYVAEHFSFRPPRDDTFYYNRNRWWLEPSGVFRWRKRTVMSTCIVSRELMIDTLETKFAAFPSCPEKREGLTGWAEPGRYEWYLKLPKVRMDHFTTVDPLVTFNLAGSLGGRRSTNADDLIQTELPPWGDAKTLWDTTFGHSK